MSKSTNKLGKELIRLTEENAKLQEELWNQWSYNHAEHCGRGEGIVDIPHEGLCTWPVPEF